MPILSARPRRGSRRCPAAHPCGETPHHLSKSQNSPAQFRLPMRMTATCRMVHPASWPSWPLFSGHRKLVGQGLSRRMVHGRDVRRGDEADCGPCQVPIKSGAEIIRRRSSGVLLADHRVADAVVVAAARNGRGAVAFVAQGRRDRRRPFRALPPRTREASEGHSCRLRCPATKHHGENPAP